MEKDLNYDATIIEKTTDNTVESISSDNTVCESNNENKPKAFAANTQGKKNSNKAGLVAATAGLAIASGTAAVAYGTLKSEASEITGFNEVEDNNSAEIIEQPVEDIQAQIEAVSPQEETADEIQAEVNNDSENKIEAATTSAATKIKAPVVEVDPSVGPASNMLSTSSTISAPESIEEVGITTNVSDEMDFASAFATARRTLGTHGVFEWRGNIYGTYYDSEWEKLPQEFKDEFNEHDWGKDIEERGLAEGDTYNPKEYEGESIEDEGFGLTEEEMMTSNSVKDDMDFDTAFLVARSDVGPGGVFDWQGKTYTTFYEDEWKDLPDDSKQFYIDKNAITVTDDDDLVYDENELLEAPQTEAPIAEEVESDAMTDETSEVEEDTEIIEEVIAEEDSLGDSEMIEEVVTEEDSLDDGEFIEDAELSDESEIIQEIMLPDNDSEMIEDDIIDAENDDFNQVEDTMIDPDLSFGANDIDDTSASFDDIVY